MSVDLAADCWTKPKDRSLATTIDDSTTKSALNRGWEDPA